MLGSGGPRRERMSGVGSTYSFCAPPSRRAVWPSREAERSSFTRAGMERARDRAAAWLCTLPRIAIKPKIQERSRVMIWAGSKFCAHQDRRRERHGGHSAAAGEDTEHSIGDGPDIRGAGLHIGAVHLLKEGYQVIHSSLRGMLSCTAAGKYHGVDSVLIVLVIQEHGVDGKNGGQLFPHHLDSLVIELGQLQYCLAVSRGEALPLLFWREGRMSRYRRRCGRKEMKRAENDIR